MGYRPPTLRSTNLLTGQIGRGAFRFCASHRRHDVLTSSSRCGERAFAAAKHCNLHELNNEEIWSRIGLEWLQAMVTEDKSRNFSRNNVDQFFNDKLGMTESLQRHKRRSVVLHFGHRYMTPFLVEERKMHKSKFCWRGNKLILWPSRMIKEILECPKDVSASF